MGGGEKVDANNIYYNPTYNTRISLSFADKIEQQNT